MTEEEKVAIEMLKKIKNNTWSKKYILSADSYDANILLQLIEKLQKENEKLKSEKEILKNKLVEILEDNSELHDFIEGCS